MTSSLVYIFRKVMQCSSLQATLLMVITDTTLIFCLGTLTEMCIMTTMQLNVLAGPSKVPSINVSKEVRCGALGFLSGSDAYHASSDATLFSSSLPVLPHENCMRQLLLMDYIIRFTVRNIQLTFFFSLCTCSETKSYRRWLSIR